MAETIDVFQIHYYLKGNQHSMNAEVLNKAQAEVIKISKEITNLLGLDIDLEMEALDEGGIKSIFKFIDKGFSKKKKHKKANPFEALKPELARIVVDVIVIVAGFYFTNDGEMKELEKEKVRLEIEVLKEQLSKDDATDDDKEVVIKNFIQNAADSANIKIAKSNFFDSISREAKVDEVSAQRLNKNFIPFAKEYKIDRKQFDRYILEEQKLEPKHEEQVSIEIVSPVLNQSSLQWNALHSGELIRFRLKDHDFQRMIVRKNLNFQNGTILVCDLVSNQKIGKNDKLKTTSRYVMNVTKIKYRDGDVVDINYSDLNK